MPPKEIIIILQDDHVRGEEPTTLSSSSGHSRRPLIPRSDSYRKYRRRCHYLMERERSNSKGSESSFSTGTDAVLADGASLPVIGRSESPTVEGNDNVFATTGDSPLETKPVKHHHHGLMPLGSLAEFLSKEVTKAQEKGLYYHCSASKLNCNLRQDGPPIVKLDECRKIKRSSSSGHLS